MVALVFLVICLIKLWLLVKHGLMWVIERNYDKKCLQQGEFYATITAHTAMLCTWMGGRAV